MRKTVHAKSPGRIIPLILDNEEGRLLPSDDVWILFGNLSHHSGKFSSVGRS